MIGNIFSLFGFRLFLRLLLAHLLADFMLQSDKICEGKTSSVRSKRLLWQGLHGLLHTIMTFALLGCWEAWWIAVAVGVLHVVIDVVKVHTPCRDSLKVFAIDQLFHIVVLCFAAIVSINIADIPTTWWGLPLNGKLGLMVDRIVIVIGYLLMIQPASIIISKILKKFEVSPNNNGDMQRQNSLEKAGRWIGYCERFIALSFILVGCYEAIGFLLAAKSIFRFGDLKESKETQMTEYVLLGTLLSMAIVVIVGIGCKYLCNL